MSEETNDAATGPVGAIEVPEGDALLQYVGPDGSHLQFGTVKKGRIYTTTAASAAGLVGGTKPWFRPVRDVDAAAIETAQADARNKAALAIAEKARLEIEALNPPAKA